MDGPVVRKSDVSRDKHTERCSAEGKGMMNKTGALKCTECNKAQNAKITEK